MITTWNAQKDKVNKLGHIKFAEDAKQALTTFYSCDTWAEYETLRNQKVGGNNVRRSNIIVPPPIYLKRIKPC